MREIGFVLLLPLLGTALGAAGVFVMGRKLAPGITRGLNGFAAGVMIAASVWSLILPALEQSEGMGQLSFLPAMLGIWLGFAFVELLSRMISGGASLTAAAVALPATLPSASFSSTLTVQPSAFMGNISTRVLPTL